MKFHVFYNCVLFLTKTSSDNNDSLHFTKCILGQKKLILLHKKTRNCSVCFIRFQISFSFLESFLDKVLYFVSLVIQTTQNSRKETEKLLSLYTANFTVFQWILSLFLRQSRVNWTTKHLKKGPYQELTLASNVKTYKSRHLRSTISLGHWFGKLLWNYHGFTHFYSFFKNFVNICSKYRW